MDAQHGNQSQESQILAWLQSGKPITPLQSLEIFGCFRLGARIHSLRKQGHDISMELVEYKGKRFAEYTLTEKSNGS